MLVALVLLIAACEGATSWLETPYGDLSFNLNADYDTNVTIYCNDSRIPATGLTFQYWVLPHLDVMKAGDVITFFSLYHLSGWKVDPGTSGVLRAYGIQEEHFGLYHCVLHEDATNETWVVKKSINLEEPYFSNLIDYYRSNIIIGFSAAFAFLIGAIVTVLTYDHVASKAKGAVEPQSRDSSDMYVHTNVAMDDDVIKSGDEKTSTSL